MGKQLRYMGEFLSRKGVTWRVELLQEADGPFAEVGGLTFEADEALTFEWEEKGKEEPLQGSIASVRVESPGDRTYEDLYTVEPGRIRMDVYREGSLYWTGALDTEFYEEPYERASLYPVSLKFSDFGILGRLKYSLSGMRTLYEIVEHCLSRAGIAEDIDESLISTSLDPGGEAMSLRDLKVRSDNFYDEDGEASTLQEVLEGILQPLGLRMVQRGGKVYVYDLNGLYAKGEQKRLEWSGDSQTLGTDVVYNNVKITWSPYAQSGNLAATECWTDETDPNLKNLNNLYPKYKGGAAYFSYHYSTDFWDWADASDAGFTFWISRNGKGAELVAGGERKDTEEMVNDGLWFFKIVPQYDGTEAEGIAIAFSAVQYVAYGTKNNYTKSGQEQPYGMTNRALMGKLGDIRGVLYRNDPVWIPPVGNADALKLRISMELLLDPRFNPFERAVNWGVPTWEQEDQQGTWKSRGNFVYVPVLVKFRAEDGKTYAWDNRDVVAIKVNSPMQSLYGTYGSWREYTETDGIPGVWGYFAYYDPSDRKDNCGVLGWKKNRTAINPHTDKISTVLEKCADGQYIPYPNFGGGGGSLWVETLYGGWMISDGGSSLSDTEISNPGDLWGRSKESWLFEKYKWILAKLPEEEIINSIQFEEEISTDDVEYSATINEAAEEELEIDTVCGTSADGVPTARGAYFRTDTGGQVTALTRAGRTTQAEELLIGTLYSQYAARHATLTGEAEADAGGLAAYTERSQPGKLFLLAADTQDAIEDTGEATFIELSPDEYKKEGEE